MNKLLKKLNTLLRLDWRWALKYYKKHLLKWVGYSFDKLRRKTFYETNINGMKLKLAFSHPYHHLIVKHFADQKFEYNLLCAWKERAKQSDLVLDVGSYNGVYALVAGFANPRARVIAFEPEQININHIRKNIELNGVDRKNIEVFEGVVTNVDGVATFSTHEGGTGGSIGNGNQVNSTTLDSFLIREREREKTRF